MPSDPTMKRIQRKRTKGWTMPDGAIYVGRGSPWGNPFVVHQPASPETRANAKSLFAAYATGRILGDLDWLDALEGHDLACWCALDQPCHADVLIALIRYARSEKRDAV
jgi:hypothetical protein